IFFIIAIGSGMRIGVTSLIARLIGAKKITKARQAASHSILIAIVLTIVSVIVGFLFIEDIFILMGADANIITLATEYMNLIFYGIIIMYMSFMLNGILLGEGDMKTPMKGMMLAIVLNIILDPILIFGFGPIPSLGIEGAALATIFSRFIGLTYIINHFTKRKNIVTPVVRGFVYTSKTLKDIIRVGLPASITNVSMSFSFIIVTFFVAKFGADAIAAFGAAVRIEMIGVLPSIAMASAIVTIAGQNAGVKKYCRVEDTVKSAVKMLSIFMVVVACMLIAFPGMFMNLFTEDAKIISLGIPYLQIVPLGFIFAAIGSSITSAFQGMGKGIPPLVFQMTRLFIVGIPLAYYLTFIAGWGLKGIWWSFVLAGFVTATISIVWFKKEIKRRKKEK
ncbi:MAG: MATE family efflux transporter, partial [Candidatus Aenigmarchaeota archaeon]|nr:MATE family efflux transporter [Candidatus Aenigmarchaeota archaeon]